jgi:hypothetical protein
MSSEPLHSLPIAVRLEYKIALNYNYLHPMDL